MTLVITSILPILIASQAVLTKLNFGATGLELPTDLMCSLRSKAW